MIACALAVAWRLTPNERCVSREMQYLQDTTYAAVPERANYAARQYCGKFGDRPQLAKLIAVRAGNTLSAAAAPSR